MTPAQQPYQEYQQPPQQQVAPQQPKSSIPFGALATSVIAAFVGLMAFLIAGFRGHSAGWEMMAIPAGLADFLALIAMGLGAGALMKKQVIGGLLAIAIGGFGGLLATVGFILGA